MNNNIKSTPMNLTIFMRKQCNTNIMHSVWDRTHKFCCSVVSASSNASCNFDDIDICGYQDLSETGINWSQIYIERELISYFIVRDRRYVFLHT